MEQEFGSLSRERRPRAYAYKRAKNFYGCLALEGSVSAAGFEPLLVRAWSNYRENWL